MRRPARSTSDVDEPCPDRIIDRFDRWAGSYDASQLQELLYTRVHHAVLCYARRHVQRPGRILDVGCGTGRLLRRMADHYGQARLTGVDASTEMIRCAARPVARCGYAGLAAARAEQLPFADAVFDLVVITLSLTHWRDRHRGLAEICRVTAPGATVLIADTLRSRPRRFRTVRLHSHRVLLPDDVRGSITASGLRIRYTVAIRSVAPIADVSLIVAAKPVDAVRPR